MKKVGIIVLLIAAMSLIGNGSLYAENDQGSDKAFLSFISEEERSIIEEIGIERFAREISSNETYKQLTATFGFDPYTAQYNAPDYYGGAFIDQDGGLVINVKEGFENYIEDLQARTGGGEYRIQYVKHNIQELYEIIWKLKDHLAGVGGDLNDNFVGFGLDERNAKVFLFVIDDDFDKVKEIYQYENDPELFTVVPQGGDGKIIEDTAILAGNPTSKASVAYRAYELDYNGMSVYGVLTAGHVVYSGDYIKTTDNVAFAKCISRQYGGTADAAFCKITNSSYSPTNVIRLQSGCTLGLGETNPSTGSTVFKSGAATGVTSGQVYSSYWTGAVNGVSFYGLTLATYSSAGGDSGGIVYQISNNQSDTVGIHMGHTDVMIATTFAIYTKAMVVDGLFDCSRY